MKELVNIKIVGYKVRMSAGVHGVMCVPCNDKDPQRKIFSPIETHRFIYNGDEETGMCEPDDSWQERVCEFCQRKLSDCA